MKKKLDENNFKGNKNNFDVIPEEEDQIEITFLVLFFYRLV